MTQYSGFPIGVKIFFTIPYNTQFPEKLSLVKGLPMLQLLSSVIHAIAPFLGPVCFVCAWLIIFLIFWSIFSAIVSTIKIGKQMHQIPCANCVFFTKDYHLKCPVQPKLALTEAAIGCLDFRSHHQN